MCTGSIVLLQVVLQSHSRRNTKVPAAEPFGKIHMWESLIYLYSPSRFVKAFMLHNPRLQTRAHIHTRAMFSLVRRARSRWGTSSCLVSCSATTRHFYCVPVQKLITDLSAPCGHIWFVLSKFSYQVLFPFLVFQPFPKSEPHQEMKQNQEQSLLAASHESMSELLFASFSVNASGIELMSVNVFIYPDDLEVVNWTCYDLKVTRTSPVVLTQLALSYWVINLASTLFTAKAECFPISFEGK